MQPLNIKHAIIVITAILGLMFNSTAYAEKTVIKVAVVMPEGSTWTKTLYRMVDEVRKQTHGEVDFKVYAGGVSGDEPDVLRKMQVNRIHAAGFSGVGLGIILPKIRILEAPLLCRSYDEVDLLKERLYDEFSAGFEKKGFVLLGFAEAGYVYFFSRENLSEANAFESVKMWAWKGDRLAQTFLEACGIRTFPLHVTDVNTGLETGMIDSFYSPPLAAVAFQWYSRVRYMLDFPMVNSTGALLIKKSTFYRLSKNNQEILRDTARRYCKKLVRLTRQDNIEARAVLKDAGIQFITPSDDLMMQFQKIAKRAYDENIPELYSEAFFSQAIKILEEYRKADSGS